MAPVENARVQSWLHASSLAPKPFCAGFVPMSTAGTTRWHSCPALIAAAIAGCASVTGPRRWLLKSLTPMPAHSAMTWLKNKSEAVRKALAAQIEVLSRQEGLADRVAKIQQEAVALGFL